ncbi:Alpha/Beta hydrolase protein [Entophlyctis helioformis]|nr:Alpha/Beta hydrolase protein [Entophlyctis helioformis]
MTHAVLQQQGQQQQQKQQPEPHQLQAATTPTAGKVAVVQVYNDTNNEYSHHETGSSPRHHMPASRVHRWDSSKLARSGFVLPRDAFASAVDLAPARPMGHKSKISHSLPYAVHLALHSVLAVEKGLSAALSHAIDGPLFGNWSLMTTVVHAILRSFIIHNPPQARYTYGTLTRIMNAVQVPALFFKAHHREVNIDIENTNQLATAVAKTMDIERNLLRPTTRPGQAWRTLKAEWIRHKDLAPPTDSEPVVLYLHGGGHNFMSPATHRHLTSKFSLVCNATLLVPDYRLGMECGFPAAVEDSLAAYLALTGIKPSSEYGALFASDSTGIAPQGPIAPSRIFIMGDSSGGGLCMQLVMLLRSLGLPAPGGCVLLSPFLDLELQSPSWHMNFNTDYLTAEVPGIYWSLSLYCNGVPRRHPSITPLYADLSNLPPILVQAGEAETLRDDSLWFHSRACEANSPVEIELYHGMFHVFQLFSMTQESEEAIQRIGVFVTSVMKGTTSNATSHAITGSPAPTDASVKKSLSTPVRIDSAFVNDTYDRITGAAANDDDEITVADQPTAFAARQRRSVWQSTGVPSRTRKYIRIVDGHISEEIECL